MKVSTAMTMAAALSIGGAMSNSQYTKRKQNKVQFEKRKSKRKVQNLSRKLNRK